MKMNIAQGLEKVGSREANLRSALSPAMDNHHPTSIHSLQGLVYRRKFVMEVKQIPEGTGL